MVHIDDAWRHHLALAIVRRAREENVPLADTQAALVQSMIPTDLPTWTTRLKSGYDRIYQRVKWRVQNTAQNGLAFSLFENVPADTPLETDLAMIRGNTAAQGAQPPEQCNDLKPEDSKRGAIEFCARLVCHVWNTDEHGGKKRSTDYVFMKAQKGDSLFGECKRARELLKRWAISIGTIQTDAARLHAAQSGTKHQKRDGMERPETMRQAAKKSRAKEDAEIRAEERAQGKRKAKQGARQSGKKR